MSNEDEIIKKRLLIEGDSGNEDRCINKLIKLFIKYCDEPNRKESEGSLVDDTSTQSLQMMMALISHIEFGLVRNNRLLDMNKQEQENYAELYKKVDFEIEKSKLNIVKHKIELEEARKVRKNRQEYDLLAKEILKLPDRLQMQSTIETLTKKLEDLKQQKNDADKKIDLRRKQFSVVVKSLSNLKVLLERDQHDEQQQQHQLVDIDFSNEETHHETSNKMETSTIEDGLSEEDEGKSPRERAKMDLDD